MMGWIWMVVIAFLVLLIAGAGGKQNGKRPAKPCRIDHPHYITDDESECSACGARFSKKLSTCPRCGVAFDSVKKDEDEWYDEFDEECAWDEEEG